MVWQNIKMGSIDTTLFTKSIKSDILLVQIYVDDITFGSTNNDIYQEFAKIWLINLTWVWWVKSTTS